jgi:hypothetical protein
VVRHEWRQRALKAVEEVRRRLQGLDHPGAVRRQEGFGT